MYSNYPTPGFRDITRAVSLVDPTGRIDYTYGSSDCTSCGGNDLPIAVARTDSATGAVERMDFTHDGAMTTGVTFTGAVAGSIAWTFDANFWITSESVNGNAVNFTYDNDGRLKSAGDMTITRDSQNGFLTGTALVNASVAIADSYAYSTFGETTSYNAKVSGASVFDVQYTRDAIGRIVTKTETIGGADGAGGATVYEYSYDVAGRLVAVKEDGVTVSTYDYDANGNRITAVTRAGTFQGFYDLQDRMTKYGDADYTYTANGELLTKTDPAGTTTYDYDVFGNLGGVLMPDGTRIEYIIDASNRRIGKKVNGALVQGFIYKDQLEPVAELDGAGNVTARFVYASKGHVPDYMVKSGATYRIISNHLGSVRLVVNAADGTITQRIDYDEFGNIVSDSHPGFQPFAFAGGIYDQHTKLTRFGARDYDAHTGRWTSKDPIRFKGDSINLYCYVLADPANLIDTKGLSAATGILGGLAGRGFGRGVGGLLAGAWAGPVGAAIGGAIGGLAGGILVDHWTPPNNGGSGDDGDDDGCDDKWCDLFSQDVYIHAPDDPLAWSLCTYLCRNPERLVSLLYYGPICPDSLPTG